MLANARDIRLDARSLRTSRTSRNQECRSHLLICVGAVPTILNLQHVFCPCARFCAHSFLDLNLSQLLPQLAILSTFLHFSGHSSCDISVFLHQFCDQFLLGTHRHFRVLQSLRGVHLHNFVPIVVPGLSCSSSGSSSTSKTPSKQESHSSSSSSASSSSPTVSEIQIREREDGINSDISPVQVSTSIDDGSGQPDKTTIERGNPCDSEIPEWLQEFRGNLVDDEIPVHRDSHASYSHEASLEPTIKRREDLGKHSVYTHFPKDRNCQICLRTKITRAPCRRRNGEAVPRAVNFGDLITADHKVLSDNCESRNNHRYAVVVQDLATQWIQAYPCKNKTS